MKKAFVLLFFSIFTAASGTVSAAEKDVPAAAIQPSGNKIADTPEAKIMTMEEYNRTEMDDTQLEGFNEMINDEGKVLTSDLKTGEIPAIRVFTYSSLFKEWSQNINIEIATDKSRKWFEAISVQLKKLAVCKNRMETAVLEKNKQELEEARSDYSKELKKYLAIIHNPEKPEKQNRQPATGR